MPPTHQAVPHSKSTRVILRDTRSTLGSAMPGSSAFGRTAVRRSTSPRCVSSRRDGFLNKVAIILFVFAHRGELLEKGGDIPEVIIAEPGQDGIPDILTGGSRLLVPLARLDVVLGHALALLIERADVVHGAGIVNMPGRGRFPAGRNGPGEAQAAFSHHLRALA